MRLEVAEGGIDVGVPTASDALMSALLLPIVALEHAHGPRGGRRFGLPGANGPGREVRADLGLGDLDDGLLGLLAQLLRGVLGGQRLVLDERDRDDRDDRQRMARMNASAMPCP